METCLCSSLPAGRKVGQAGDSYEIFNFTYSEADGILIDSKDLMKNEAISWTDAIVIDMAGFA